MVSGEASDEVSDEASSENSEEDSTRDFAHGGTIKTVQEERNGVRQHLRGESKQPVVYVVRR